MSVCPQCQSEMMDNVSCLPDPIKIGERLYDPIRWGTERERPGRKIDYPCRDCYVPPGGVHHPGCCVERCPACLGQALGCPCFGSDEDDWDDEDYGDGPDDMPAAATTWAPPPMAHLKEASGHLGRPLIRCTVHLLTRPYRT